MVKVRVRGWALMNVLTKLAIQTGVCVCLQYVKMYVYKACKSRPNIYVNKIMKPQRIIPHTQQQQILLYKEF